MINKNIYQITPYGVIKHKIEVPDKYNGNDSLNACMEASLINFINKYNNIDGRIFIHIAKTILSRS